MARHYHLIGIGGSAMGSLAGLLKASGHEVTGSDEHVYPPMSDQLRDTGISYADGYRAENLDPVPDVIVVGNAISRGNPELERVLDERLHYTSAAVVIKEEFLRGREVVAVAGTHGKTTTASLVAWLLECAGRKPSFLIGGVAENFGASYRLTDSEVFVIEADEYDTAYFDKGPKFWHYLPTVAVVTNVEFDHADIYRDEEAYRFAFARFMNLVPRNGGLVAGWDSPIARDLASRSIAPVASFGLEDGGGRVSDHPHWTVSGAEYGEKETVFDVLHRGRHWGTARTTMAGAFNVLNALAAIAAADATGASREGILEGLRTFQSPRRRMEERGTVAGVTVVDDFAHHPTAVRATLAAGRQRYPGRRLVAVFEPRSYTAQRKEFQASYQEVLADADVVVMASIARPERYTAETALSPEEVVARLAEIGIPAAALPDADAITAHLAGLLRPGDVVMVMSNGGFGGIHEKLLAALENAAPEAGDG